MRPHTGVMGQHTKEPSMASRVGWGIAALSILIVLALTTSEPGVRVRNVLMVTILGGTLYVAGEWVRHARRHRA